mgnify:CR=1 FL=1
MKIIIRYYGLIREKIGVKEEKIDVEGDSTLQDITDFLTRRWKHHLEELIKNNPAIFLNGRSIFLLNSLKSRVTEGSVIEVIPLYMGG